MAQGPSQSTVKALFAYSGNVCAYQDPIGSGACEQELTNPRWRRVRGQLCHIHGEKPGSARYDPTMSEQERHSFDNLILLCPNHHNLIDDLEPDRHPAEFLHGLKDRMVTTRWRPSEVLLDRIVRIAIQQWFGSADWMPDAQREPTARERYAWLFPQIDAKIYESTDDWSDPPHINPERAAQALPEILKMNDVKEGEALPPAKLESIVSALRAAGGVEDAYEI
jgi:hypothetical protein